MRSEARSEEERVMLRFKDHSIPDLLTKPEIRTALQSQSMKEIPLIFFLVLRPILLLFIPVYARTL